MVGVALLLHSNFNMALIAHSSSSLVLLSLSVHLAAARRRACTQYQTPTQTSVYHQELVRFIAAGKRKINKIPLIV